MSNTCSTSQIPQFYNTYETFDCSSVNKYYKIKHMLNTSKSKTSPILIIKLQPDSNKVNNLGKQFSIVCQLSLFDVNNNINLFDFLVMITNLISCYHSILTLKSTLCHWQILISKCHNLEVIISESLDKKKEKAGKTENKFIWHYGKIKLWNQ